MNPNLMIIDAPPFTGFSVSVQMAGFLQSLSQRFQVNILVYDYSGYGASSGQTLEDNLYADAEAALAELRARYLCSLSRIVLYGQSIGTAPTVELATHHKVSFCLPAFSPSYSCLYFPQKAVHQIRLLGDELQSLHGRRMLL
ncbi:unnamed protein product [Schistocephalus solidus]|uniref:Protein ABHD13 n=1 Tax=Schistocephalus solidus TaxID=70667 RepID=A0A183SWQ6_SCHSO|nr:unnamed protein product [Schistocephalus solidus]